MFAAAGFGARRVDVIGVRCYNPVVVVADVELVRLAQGGDIGALGVLLERHRARLHAVGVAMLRAGPHNEDLVHDVFIVAVRQLEGLRDPDAAGAWLTGIARNLCLRRLRERRELPLEVLGPGWDVSSEPSPEDVLDGCALGDWVWASLGGLSEPLRDTVVLRYFSRASSYEAIAATLDVPVGTVRSRLSEARRKLGVALREQGDRYHGDHAVVAQDRRAFFLEVNAEYNRGLGCTQLVAALAADVELRSTADPAIYRGPEAIARGLEADIEAGMRLRILDVIAGEGITIVEGAFENPPDDPHHCPPVTTQLFVHRGDGIRAMRLHFADTA